MDIKHFMDVYGGEDFVHEMEDADLVLSSQKLKRAIVFMCQADEEMEEEMRRRRIGRVVDDVCVYSRPRSSNEIEGLYLDPLRLGS